MKASDLISEAVEQILAGVQDARDKGLVVFDPQQIDFEIPWAPVGVTRFSVSLPAVQQEKEGGK